MFVTAIDFCFHLRLIPSFNNAIHYFTLNMLVDMLVRVENECFSVETGAVGQEQRQDTRCMFLCRDSAKLL